MLMKRPFHELWRCPMQIRRLMTREAFPAAHDADYTTMFHIIDSSVSKQQPRMLHPALPNLIIMK